MIKQTITILGTIVCILNTILVYTIDHSWMDSLGWAIATGYMLISLLEKDIVHD